MGKYDKILADFIGDLAQLVRASRLHREGRGSESLSPHQSGSPKERSPLLSFVFGDSLPQISCLQLRMEL